MQGTQTKTQNSSKCANYMRVYMYFTETGQVKIVVITGNHSLCHKLFFLFVVHHGG